MRERPDLSEDIVVDTDVFSFILRNDSRAASYMSRFAGVRLHLSFCTVGEALFGVERLPESQTKRELAEGIERELRRYTIVEPSITVARHWAAIRAECERDGNTIPREDAWVAACARMLGCAVATHNERHFRNVRGLEIVTLVDGAVRRFQGSNCP